MEKPEKRFYTLEEIAEYLNESPFTIYYWCQIGKIPHYKRGKRLMFDLEEIIKWDKENNYRGVASIYSSEEG